MNHFSTRIPVMLPKRILFLCVWTLLFCQGIVLSQPFISDSKSLTNTTTSYVEGLSHYWFPVSMPSNSGYTSPGLSQFILSVRDSLDGRVVNNKALGITIPDDVMVATNQSLCANSGGAWLWASGGTEYHWSPADGLNRTDGNSIMADPSTTTTYTVAITVGDSCIIERQVTLEVLPARQLEFRNGGIIALCLGQTGQFGLIPEEDVSYAWNPWDALSDRYAADPVVTALTTSATYYTVWAYDTMGCVTSATVCVVVPKVQLAIDVLLEGAAVADSMSCELQLQDFLPFNQPFGAEPFYYNGNETLAQYENKTDIVDWVFIELRDALTPTTVIDRRAALLRTDGRVLDPYGLELLGFYNQILPDSFYIAVWHRNHLGVMSALPVHITGSNCTAVYDFTESVYHNFGNEATLLSNGKYGMMVGDSQQDGIINAVDRVAVRNRAGQMGYLVEDLTFDGIVNALDRILVRYNTARISHIPSN